MRVYLSGPMTGCSEFNYPTFTAVAAKWREAFAGTGSVVLNPAENFDGATDLNYATYLRVDIEMIQSADAIAMLPGWRNSRGARFELMLAQMLNLEVFNADTMQPIDAPQVRTTLKTEAEENPMFILYTRESGLVH